MASDFLETTPRIAPGSVSSSSPETQDKSESWRTYGLSEPIIKDFVSKYSNGYSMDVRSIEISVDGALSNERSFSDKDTLWNFLTAEKVAPSTSIRVLLVKEMSGEALQLMSTALGIHLAFWAWVASEQASDGFWLNTHNDGKILSFDLPGFEFYSAKTPPAMKVVREGRLKQLSSRHRFYGAGLTGVQSHDVYINRRTSGYLIPMDGFYTFVYLAEDCRAVSSLPLQATERTQPLCTEWFMRNLKEAETETLVKFTKEPVGIILEVVKQLLRTWHSFTVQVQRDLEVIDESLPESLPDQLPEHNLYDIGTYLHRDIVQTLYRFNLQLGKYEGYLKYLGNGTKPQFRPDMYIHDTANLTNNLFDLRRRLEGCKDRGNMSLTLINNYISLQQARLANRQALISAEMARLQVQDSQAGGRLSVVATVFLPLSFATSWLSINQSMPIWIFFVIAVGSMLATAGIILILKWTEEFELLKRASQAFHSVLHPRRRREVSDEKDSYTKYSKFYNEKALF